MKQREAERARNIELARYDVARRVEAESRAVAMQALLEEKGFSASQVERLSQSLGVQRDKEGFISGTRFVFSRFRIFFGAAV